MEEKKAPKKRLGQKKEPPEAFMASFFASVEVYQTKILVRYFPQPQVTKAEYEYTQETKIVCFHRTIWPGTSTTSVSWRSS